MNYYRQVPGPAQGPYPSRFFPFLGAPLIGGFVGGLLGSALVRPRPVPYPYGAYPGYGGYYYGGYYY
ncbi:hypothetical protein [Heyndrickxia acidicola]|uniref:Spore coat protein n=1 Tax=Heyndrickxia acidicola TaxID=209389 RepID=A0ABU6MNL3_9BACI|nr:hypothetical protein [Heyndrickxia acidicola]MED1205919.1 hypothetical protein [Heyndrickxia acidicola]